VAAPETAEPRIAEEPDTEVQLEADVEAEQVVAGGSEEGE
jgi:hypothetical protein